MSSMPHSKLRHEEGSGPPRLPPRRDAQSGMARTSSVEVCRCAPRQVVQGVPGERGKRNYLGAQNLDSNEYGEALDSAALMKKGHSPVLPVKLPGKVRPRPCSGPHRELSPAQLAPTSPTRSA